MEAFAQLTPPTAVTHALSLPFLSSDTSNLIVVKTSLLQIFEIRNVPNNTAIASQPINSSSQLSHRLSLVGEYHVSGAVTSLARIKVQNTKSGGDALLVSTRNARISLVEWNPETYNLSTISVHYYEGLGVQESPWTPDESQYPSFLAADPGNRCAILKFGRRHLAILPLKQQEDHLASDDFDADLDDGFSEPKQGTQLPNGIAEKETPYHASYVSTLTSLDPSLLHPVDLAFLHEYREPTLGVLASSTLTSSSLLMLRRDVLTYSVFALDTKARATTQLFSVSGLPSDIFEIVPCTAPIGGVLLLGSNELIHIDQAGKIQAIAVNEFATTSTSFSTADQRALRLRLENCVVQQLRSQKTNILIVTGSGKCVMLKFKLDGRSITGMTLQLMSGEVDGPVVRSAPSCIAQPITDLIFIGSKDANSVLIRCTKRAPQLSRKRSYAEMLGLDADADLEAMDDIGDEDDLYADAPSAIPLEVSKTSKDNSLEDYQIVRQDYLPNYKAVAEPALGRRKSMDDSQKSTGSQKSSDDLQMILPTGLDSAGTLAFMTRDVSLLVKNELGIKNTDSVWSVALQESLEAPNYDNYLVVAHSVDGRPTTSSIHAIQDQGIRPVEGSEFEAEANTLFCSVLCNHSRLIQISHKELRCYDPALTMTQILPMLDEETEAELMPIHASFLDPYILLVRNDYSAVVLKADARGEFDEVSCGGHFSSKTWRSGSIHGMSTEKSDAMLYMLSNEGHLYMFALPNLSQSVYYAPTLNLLPPILTQERPPKHADVREDLTELLVTDIGDSIMKSPYLIVRNVHKEVELYQPYQHPATLGNFIDPTLLKWRRASNSYMSDDEFDNTLASNDKLENETGAPLWRPSCLESIGDLSNSYSAVFIPGKTPALILKEGRSVPRIIRLKSPGMKSLRMHHTPNCQRGCIVVDSQGVHSADLPSNTSYCDIGWAVSQLHLDGEIEAICYHPELQVYAVAVTQETEFRLPEDETHPEWKNERSDFLPKGTRCTIKLIDVNVENFEIDTLELDDREITTSLETVSLEVSEKTHERKTLIAAGTAIIRGEDLPATGSVYILEIIQVVPEPDRPETNRRFKIITKSDAKGAVTALSGLESRGLLLQAEGQKCMVRGLREDTAFLPVAFMDMHCYVNVIKNLPGTGMCLIGDALKGLYFVGYEQEPFRLNLFGKSRTRLPVMAAEFLPRERQLFVVVADDDSNIAVLEYNPDNPKTENGHRLLRKSAFHTGHCPISMTLLLYYDKFNEAHSHRPDMTNRKLKEASANVNGNHEPPASDDIPTEDERPSATVAAPNGFSSPAPNPAYPPNAISNVESGPTPNSSPSSSRSSTPSPPADPSPPAELDAQPQHYQILSPTTTGAVTLLTTLPEADFRRLSLFQAYLTSALEHPLGLNPRTYRTPQGTGLDASGGRGEYSGAALDTGAGAGVLDGSILGRWRELGTRGRYEAWYRVVGGGWMAEREKRGAIRMLDGLLGGGLGFL